MNAFFDELGAAFASEAKARGAEISAPKLDAPTADELLQLASVVAHTKERRFAPLACYLAGVAAGHAQAKNSSFDVAELCKAVREKYLPQEDSSGKTG